MQTPETLTHSAHSTAGCWQAAADRAAGQRLAAAAGGRLSGRARGGRGAVHRPPRHQAPHQQRRQRRQRSLGPPPVPVRINLKTERLSFQVIKTVPAARSASRHGADSILESWTPTRWNPLAAISIWYARTASCAGFLAIEKTQALRERNPTNSRPKSRAQQPGLPTKTLDHKLITRTD